MIISETPETLKAGNIVSVRVTSIKKDMDFVYASLPNGIIGRIKQFELRDSLHVPLDQKKVVDLRQYVSVGQMLPAKIKAISWDKWESRRSIAELITRESEVKEDVSWVSELPRPARFDRDAELREYSSSIQPKETKSGYIERSIKHPQFRNYSHMQTIERLKDAAIGTAVFRPSRQGIHHITLAIAIGNGHVYHVDVEDPEAKNSGSHGSRLVIRDVDVYEDLDEILVRFVGPISHLVTEFRHHKYFTDSDITETTTALQSRLAQSGTASYALCHHPTAENKLAIISLSNDKGTVRTDSVGLHPDGYILHKSKYKNLPLLLKAFKDSHSKAPEIPAFGTASVRALPAVLTPAAPVPARQAPMPMSGMPMSGMPISGMPISGMPMSAAQPWSIQPPAPYIPPVAAQQDQFRQQRPDERRREEPRRDDRHDDDRRRHDDRRDDRQRDEPRRDDRRDDRHRDTRDDDRRRDTRPPRDDRPARRDDRPKPDVVKPVEEQPKKVSKWDKKTSDKPTSWGDIGIEKTI